jgi:hypothetical protein
MLDDWQRRLEAAPAFGPTFEGFDYKTPEYNRLAETQSALSDLSRSVELSERGLSGDISPDEVKKAADHFKDAFIANRQNLQAQLGPSVTPVNELLDRFHAASPGAANLRAQGRVDDYRHEIYSHLYPWEANLSPDYRGFQGNRLNYQASPITPLNEGVAVWTDKGMAEPNSLRGLRADDPSNIGNYFKDFVNRVAENDDAYAVPGGQEIWLKQHGAGKDQSQKLADIGSLYREKYIEPATQRYQNLAQAQAPMSETTLTEFNGGSRSLRNNLTSYGRLADNELILANLPRQFSDAFIERNLLYGTDPVTAGLQGAKEMLRTAPAGLAGGAALSALSPAVAQSVAQGKYGQAATQTAKDLAGGTAADLAIRSAGQGLQRVAPQIAARVNPLVAAAADVAVPAAVGAGLFMQGQKGSPLNTLVNAASNTPIGLKVNPKTDVGRMAGNELQYALGQLLGGKIPYTGR